MLFSVDWVDWVPIDFWPIPTWLKRMSHVSGSWVCGVYPSSFWRRVLPGCCLSSLREQWEKHPSRHLVIMWPWVKTYGAIFGRINIHLPSISSILMFTRVPRFWPMAIWWFSMDRWFGVRMVTRSGFYSIMEDGTCPFTADKTYKFPWYIMMCPPVCRACDFFCGDFVHSCPFLPTGW